MQQSGTSLTNTLIMQLVQHLLRYGRPTKKPLADLEKDAYKWGADGDDYGEHGCPKEGTNSCISCDRGYGLYGKRHYQSCGRKRCQCDNGRPRGAIACSKDRAWECKECYPGYHLEGVQCKKNVCVVNEHEFLLAPGDQRDAYRSKVGLRAKGPQCPNHNAIRAVLCKRGWFLHGGKCIKTKCTCANGRRAYGKACSRHGKEQCLRCKRGYFLTEGKRCHLKVCKCQMGENAVGERCPRHGMLYCLNCFAGRHPRKLYLQVPIEYKDEENEPGGGPRFWAGGNC